MSGPLDRLALLRPQVYTKRVSSFDRTGGNRDFITVEAGDVARIATIAGAGVVRHIWMTIACDDPMIRRNAVLRMYWDGENNPSVQSPLGDFFGQGWGENYNLTSLPLAAPNGGRALNCYFPMPFADGARIEVENESGQPIRSLYFYVDYEEHRGGIDPALGRFHAWWNRAMPGPEAGQGDRENEWETLGVEPSNPSDTHNHVYVHAVGMGHYVGVNYFVDCPTPLWYGEGDDMFLIDGEPWPGSLHGTGTEDYFNSAWCPKDLYAHPYFGYARVNGQTGWLGRTHCYRFHLEDPVHFHTDLRGSIEHGHANSLTLDLATVAYWYQSEPHAPFAPIPPRAARQPMPPITVGHIHQWRDAWRREMGGGPLWGHEGVSGEKRIE
ncbi:MAG: glycoside hydrolase family 172 protein [Capsulimonadaceae bacterium]